MVIPMSARVVKLTIITDFVRIYSQLVSLLLANHCLDVCKLLCGPT